MEKVRHREVDEVKGEKSDESVKRILAKKVEEQGRKKAIEEAVNNINSNVAEKGKK